MSNELNPTAPQNTVPAAAEAASAEINFESDEPLACPMRQPGDTSEICEACQ